MRTKDQILDGMEESLFNDICCLDFKFWTERVFGYKIKDFHLEWMHLAHNNRFVALQAFRGSAKTTMLGIVYPIWLAYYYPGKRVLYTAAGLDQAIKILDEVKNTIEDNEFLKDLMPDNPSTWKKTELKLINGSHFWARACTVRIKGLHVDYVFVDELQDITDREVYNKGISPTVNHRKGHIIAVGVPDNPGDMLEELSHRPEYVAKKYPVLKCDKDGTTIVPNESQWPEVFSVEEINMIRKRDGESAFQTQYMLNPAAEGDNDVFPAKWIENCFDYQETFGDPKFEESTCIIGADFAISQGARADYDCYVVVERISGKVIIRYAERHRGTPKDAKLSRLRELYARFKPVRMIFDPSNIGAAIVQDLRNEGLPVQEGEFYAKARHALLVTLQLVMQPDKNGNSELVIPRDAEDGAALTFSNKLVEELIGFKEERSKATGIKSYVSKARHDDTVAALALACKGASEQREFLDDMVGM